LKKFYALNSKLSLLLRTIGKRTQKVQNIRKNNSKLDVGDFP